MRQYALLNYSRLNPKLSCIVSKDCATLHNLALQKEPWEDTESDSDSTDDGYDDSGKVLIQFGLEEEKSADEDDDFVPSEIQ